MRTRSIAVGLVVLAACADPVPVVVGDSTGTTTGDGSSSGDPPPIPEPSESSSGAAVDETSESTGAEPPLVCELPAGSPPAVSLDGFLLAPIDVLAVDATLRFDAAAQSATGSATMTFATGPEGGMPVFDLRQPITTATLDGADVPLDLIAFFQPGGDPLARMRAIGQPLEPCSEHELVLSYDLGIPDVSLWPDAPLFVFGDEGVVWSSRFVDVLPARFAEQWIPANLPHDEMDLDILIEVVGTASPHVLGSNGTIEVLDTNKWRVEFPPHFTSMSPLVVLSPEPLVELGSAPVRLPDGTTVTIDVMRASDYNATMEDIFAVTGEALVATNLELGEYLHGDRFFVFANAYAGMEYEGATDTYLEATAHEVFHSWIARGVRPLTHRDGWLDEAWTTYATNLDYEDDPLNLAAPPVAIAIDDPWSRATSLLSYSVGPRIFATIAAEIGIDELRGLLREFYVAHAGQFVTSEQLEAHLACATPGGLVREVFARFVYGKLEPEGDLPPCR